MLCARQRAAEQNTAQARGSSRQRLTQPIATHHYSALAEQWRLIGGLLAILLDQRIRLENFFRITFLYPMSLSLVVTGLAWQWMLNPTLGLQKLAHDMGFHEFTLDWVVSSKYAIYTVVLAAVWHGSGLIMVLFLAGLIILISFL